MKFYPFSETKKKLLKNKKFREEYEKLEPEFKLACKLIEKRIERGLTQAALAKKMKTKQSAIARLESGSYNMTLAFLDRAAKALDTHVVISFYDNKPSKSPATAHSR
ncbi:MAG: helix-turn-helix transcriptional regulator [Candidatus Uhrbacteria bacterium]|nr:helix-turn-helix transcriptional regulator [Candidatus Uhrbacteria bacterium]